MKTQIAKQSRAVLGAFGIALAAWSSAPAAPVALDTPSYAITLDSSCGEKTLVCDKVAFNAVSKKSGKAVTLTGNTVHGTDRQGAPSVLQGYEFKNAKTVYFIAVDGSLTITRDGKHVLSEIGKWVP